jgi:hypothetical protein
MTAIDAPVSRPAAVFRFTQRPLVLAAALAGILPALFCGDAMAGTWNAGNWGQMYWGTNPETTPVAPTVSNVTVDGTDLQITVADYAIGSGDDGWSVITRYEVTCGDAPTVVSTSPLLRLGDLEADTPYECTVRVANALGSSPAVVQLATTGAALQQGIPITIIYSALCRSANPPASCD